MTFAKFDSTLAQRISQVRSGALVLCVSLALFALVGNIFQIDWLRNFTPWGTYIKTNPAICLLLVSIALWMQSRGKRGTAGALVVLVIVVTLITLGEWVFGFDAGLDQLLSKEIVIRDQTFPGRMPPNACLCFLSLAISVLAYSAPKKIYGQIFAAVSFAIALLSLIGLAFGLKDFGMFLSSTVIAFPMAIALSLASVASFLTYPTEGLAGVFGSQTYGGLIARSIIPLTAVVPVIGALSGIGHWSYQDLVLLALFNAIVMPIVVWLAAIRVDRLDAERQRAFEAVIKAKEAADLANAEKARLIATVSHEVRTPLAGVIGLNEIISLAKLDSETKSLADLALESSKRLMHVLNDLLDVSKLEAGKIELEEREVSPGAIVGDAVLACHAVTLQKPIQIESHVDPRIPETVIGDQLRIGQILLNFVNNAAKFTESGTIHISADWISESDDSLVVRFAVKDSGIGISKDSMEGLFQPFAQADGSIYRRYGGTGLGLSIAKHLAELMGGRTGASSKANDGSTFWVELPFRRPQAPT